MRLVMHGSGAAFCQMPFLYECALLRFRLVISPIIRFFMRSLFVIVLCLICLFPCCVFRASLQVSASYCFEVIIHWTFVLTRCRSPYQQLPQQQQSAGFGGPPGLPQGLSQNGTPGNLNGLGPLSPRGPASPSNGPAGSSDQAFSQQLNFNSSY